MHYIPNKKHKPYSSKFPNASIILLVPSQYCTSLIIELISLDWKVVHLMMILNRVKSVCNFHLITNHDNDKFLYFLFGI